MSLTVGILNLEVSLENFRKVFVGSIVNIRNECLFHSGFIENELECGTNKLPENRFVVHRRSHLFPMNPENKDTHCLNISTFQFHVCTCEKLIVQNKLKMTITHHKTQVEQK